MTSMTNTNTSHLLDIRRERVKDLERHVANAKAELAEFEEALAAARTAVAISLHEIEGEQS